MARKTCPSRYSGKSRSLIAAGILAPHKQLAGCIPEIKRQVARLLEKPVTDVYDIRLMQHQMWVLCKGADDRPCAQFFSYRRLPIWQALVLRAIANCPTLQKCHAVSGAARWEYRRFDYAVEVRDVIDEALEERLCQLQAVAQPAED